MLQKALVMLGVVAMAASGCGGDDASSGAKASTTSTSAASAPTKAEVATHLLGLADLASSDPLDAQWIAGDATAGVAIELPVCVDEDAVAGDTTASAKFVMDTAFKLPSLEEHLTGFADASGAQAAFGDATTRLDGCTPVFTYQGEPSAATIARLDLPTFGERSQAWRISVTIAGTQVSITSIHVVRGDLEMALVHTDVSTPDPATISALVTKATAKLG